MHVIEKPGFWTLMCGVIAIGSFHLFLLETDPVRIVIDGMETIAMLFVVLFYLHSRFNNKKD